MTKPNQNQPSATLNAATAALAVYAMGAYVRTVDHRREFTVNRDGAIGWESTPDGTTLRRGLRPLERDIVDGKALPAGFVPKGGAGALIAALGKGGALHGFVEGSGDDRAIVVSFPGALGGFALECLRLDAPKGREFVSLAEARAAAATAAANRVRTDALAAARALPMMLGILDGLDSKLIPAAVARLSALVSMMESARVALPANVRKALESERATLNGDALAVVDRALAVVDAPEPASAEPATGEPVEPEPATGDTTPEPEPASAKPKR